MPRNFLKKKSQVRPKKEEKWRKKGKCITLVKEEKKKPNVQLIRKKGESIHVVCIVLKTEPNRELGVDPIRFS